MSIEQTQNEAVLAVIVSVAVALRHLPLALAAFPHWHLVLASLKAALLQQLKVCACVYMCVFVCVCISGLRSSLPATEAFAAQA